MEFLRNKLAVFLLIIGIIFLAGIIWYCLFGIAGFGHPMGGTLV